MISFLKGNIYKLDPLELHLDVNGVGYKIHITLSDSEKLSTLRGQPVLIHTRVQYSENSQTIFGFLDEQIACLYDFLIKLHGIGPKIVMSILSYCNTSDFLSSLESGNTAYLTGVPGIGKSKAEKIIFEAKLKQKKLEIIKAQWAQKNQLSGSTGKSVTGLIDPSTLKNDIFTDLLTQSLEGLGFSSKEITLAEKKIAMIEKEIPEPALENIQRWIRIYLKYL
jgi:Holliday junction DNA helicase RuvA